MRFILRMAFWLTVILVLLPSGGSQPTQGQCQRLGCRVGGGCDGFRHEAILGRRRSLHGRIAGRGCDRPPRPGRRQDAIRVPQRPTRTERHRRDRQDCRRQARPSQHTLTAADLAPAWRGAQPHREARREPSGLPLTPDFPHLLSPRREDRRRAAERLFHHCRSIVALARV